MITSLYANKVFIKIQRYFIIIIFSIPGRKGSFLNLKKGIHSQIYSIFYICILQIYG